MLLHPPYGRAEQADPGQDTSVGAVRAKDWCPAALINPTLVSRPGSGWSAHLDGGATANCCSPPVPGAATGPALGRTSRVLQGGVALLGHVLEDLGRLRGLRGRHKGGGPMRPCAGPPGEGAGARQAGASSCWQSAAEVSLCNTQAASWGGLCCAGTRSPAGDGHAHQGRAAPTRRLHSRRHSRGGKCRISAPPAPSSAAVPCRWLQWPCCRRARAGGPGPGCPAHQLQPFKHRPANPRGTHHMQPSDAAGRDARGGPGPLTLEPGCCLEPTSPPDSEPPMPAHGRAVSAAEHM